MTKRQETQSLCSVFKSSLFPIAHWSLCLNNLNVQVNIHAITCISFIAIGEYCMESIMERMLQHLLAKEEPPAALEEARKAIFTHDSGKYNKYNT